MATTVHEPPKSTLGRDSEARLSHDGGWRGLTPSGGGQLALEDSSPASRTGIWVGIAAITMTFVAFTSAMVVRQGSSLDWKHFALPSVLYLDTALLLASSLPWNSRASAPRPLFMADRLREQRRHFGSGLPWYWGCFLGGQYMAWLQLRSEGLYLASNPSSSFFYLFTAAHAFHVLGGLAGLLLVIARFNSLFRRCR